MDNNEKNPTKAANETSEDKNDFELSETWAQDAMQDIEEWIESQGIYIRQ